MPTYVFPKVEHHVRKNAKCDACGKRLQRSTTLFQTLSPFNKTADGELKTRQQIGEELRAEAEKWTAQREWCTPCLEATHIRARDLVVGDVIESAVGDFTVVTLETEPDSGYSYRVRVNRDIADAVSFRTSDPVLIRPRPLAS